MNFIRSITAATLVLAAFSLHAQTITGKVVSVADGDTITVLDDQRTQHKIRLAGIDAPERKQLSDNERANTCRRWLLAE